MNLLDNILSGRCWGIVRYAPAWAVLLVVSTLFLGFSLVSYPVDHAVHLSVATSRGAVLAPSPSGPSLLPAVSLPTGAGPDVASSPAPRMPAVRTAINGTVNLTGTLRSNDTYLTGDVVVTGSTTTTGFTTTTGTATYGPTLVQGALSITGNSSTQGSILTTTPGSSVYIDPPSSASTATMSLIGNVSIGDPADTFLLTSQGATLTVWANASGGIYAQGGGYLINSGSNIQLVNYGPSSLVLNCNVNILGLGPCPVTVSAGTTYTPCYPIVGCLSASSSSITWSGPTTFSITGSVTTSSPGLYAPLPMSHLLVTVPGGGANFSMIPSQGSPSVSVQGAPGEIPSVMTYGDLDVTNGNAVAGNVTVSGNFVSQQHTSTHGYFHNLGGLTITGSLTASGDQQFPGSLYLGSNFTISTFTGQNLTVSGRLLADPEQGGQDTITLTGSLAASGSVVVQGNLSQNASGSLLQGKTWLNGSMSSTGSVLTVGTTEFNGDTTAAGNITLPNTFLGGRLSAQGNLVGIGSTDLTGTLQISGETTIENGTFLANGTTTLSGTIVGNKTDTLNGSASLVTEWGEFLNLTSVVIMGGVATVVGTVSVQGTVSTTGLSTFSSSQVDLAGGLTLNGRSLAEGAVTVTGTTLFSGAVTTTGTASFPGMTLTGDFHLSSSGGSVLSQGTSSVNGDITLSGVLTVVPAAPGVAGTFHEVGNSTISGSLNMTGSVVVTGSSTLTTTQGTELSMHGNIQLGSAAMIRGFVNTSGEVVISGSATLGGGSVVIAGYLSEIGRVFSEGNITLSGEALFSGSLDTNGTTRLPGITTVGDFAMSDGTFRIEGTTTLQGSTSAVGNVTVNSTGYFVQGFNAIDGVTDSVGSFVEQGNSTLDGSAQVAPGSTFGTYMKIVGTLNTGSLTLSGTTILPDDTVQFPSGASIRGNVSLSGTFQGTGDVADFNGQSIVYGTVSSPGMPIVNGPIVITLFGTYFAIILGPELYWFIAILVVALVVAVLDALLFGLHWRKRHELPRVSLKLRLLRIGGLLVLVAGVLVGIVGAFSLGSGLAAAPDGGEASWVAPLYYVAAGLATLGVVVWVTSRVLIRRERKHSAMVPPPPPPAPYPPFPEFAPPPETFEADVPPAPAGQ